MTFLSRFEAVLFDLNGTLATGFDRFDDRQDYHQTYSRLGGEALTPNAVTEAVVASLGRCLQRYEDGPWDPFPNYGEFLGMDDSIERRLLEDTVAEHELGSVSTERLTWLKTLAGTHRLGLVSDVWAPGRRLRDYLGRSELVGLLDAIILSSEIGAVKPSARVFALALAELDADPERVVFIGDSYRRDVEGAAACGMATVWVSEERDVPGPVIPDRVVARVEDLL
ncbi:MAG: HAD family hydrolase [Chromatiales bacterium]|jgi:putative hydrolase of the HAD superfamily/5'-nucleotidase|nr:HAD family hydrolase [Chromatiales bacterium]